MIREPTVLDYLKSLARGKPLPIPPLEAAAIPPQPLVELPQAPLPPAAEESVVAAPAIASSLRISLPWRSLLALALALVAQISLLPRPDRAWLPGAILYALSALALGWAAWRGEWAAAELPAAQEHVEDYKVRARWLYLSLPFALAAFLALGGNLFTSLNVTLWGLSIVFIFLALWQGELPFSAWWRFLTNRLRLPWKLSLSAWTVLVVAVSLVVVFFRVYRLEQVPPQMVSDHAEKLLDVWDVLHGQPHIFFPRNTGREAIQMYLTAGIIDLLHTGYTFLSLKLGTILAGLLTLPYMYLLGKELGSRRIGLFAVLFAGMAYWPNVISRIGLRFPLYPLFVAPTLYYLIRGMRTARRNDFILAGLALGIGLHGYTPIRILPLLILVAVGLFLLHPQARGKRLQIVTALLVLVLVSLLVFLPLLRFALEYPSIFDLRAFSRLGPSERALPGSAVLIFLKNLWNASTMFFWSDGNIWVHSVTGSPALDFVSAALYFLGVVLLLVRYLRRRTWQDLLLLLAVPLLMLPSILSLAFPDENPALNRAAGAIVPVFLIIAIALDGLMSAIEQRTPSRSGLYFSWGLAGFLVLISAFGNYDLVFNQYQRAYQLASWNTSDMGQVVRDFGQIYGETQTAYVVPYDYWVDTRLVGMNAGDPTRDYAIQPDQIYAETQTAYVVPYAYWVDTRLVGMNAGDPTRDYAIQPDQISLTLNDPRPKMFLVNKDDTVDMALLRQLFPQGSATLYTSQDGKDFDIYMVPPASTPSGGSPSSGGNAAP